MTTEMKPWQHGYELDYLVSLQEQYRKYNSYTDSPFAQFKKNNIAEALHTKSLMMFDDSMMKVDLAKVRSKITMHGDTVIGYKEPGDYIFSCISNPNADVKNAVSKFRDKNCWMFVWAEWQEAKEFAKDCGFDYVGCKVTTFGEIHSVWFRNSETALEPRVHPEILGAETVNITQCDFPKVNADIIRQELESAERSFINHYSNYNKKNAWSAFSLRGYREDPSFIAKPVEMSKAWKEENEGWEEWDIIDTPIRKDFRYLNEVINRIPTEKVHRIRFMRLAPGGGELSRHTDQVDPDLGVKDGRIMRLHIPVKTNPNVVFTSWDMHGIKHTVNMKEGELWYLDIRKPHMAVNGGDEERIHLVLDIEANDDCRRLLRVSQ